MDIGFYDQFNYNNCYGFYFDENEPSTHDFRTHSTIGVPPTFWNFYKRWFSAAEIGGYLKIITHAHKYEELFNSAGAFFCRVVDYTMPELDFEFTTFHKKLKDFHFQPGQIIVETPDGQHVPIYSPIAKIEKKSDGCWNYYNIKQTHSEEFISICKKYAYYYWHYDRPTSISIGFYKKSELEKIAWEMNVIKRQRQEIKSAPIVSSTPKTSWTDDEIVNLWKTTI